MVTIIYIENNDYPAGIVAEAMREVRIRDSSGKAQPVRFHMVINRRHTDETVSQAVKAYNPDVVIVDYLLQRPPDGSPQRGELYNGIEAAKCVKGWQGREGQKPNIKVILFTVRGRLPASLRDPLTGDIVYDRFVHKFFTIYPPGQAPPPDRDDVPEEDRGVDMGEVFYGGVKILLRAVKDVLEHGIIRPRDWLCPEVGDRGKPFGLAVKALVSDEQDRCLLLRRSQKSHFFKGKWDLPGGKVDRREDFISTLHREVAEETALGVSIGRVVGATEYEMPAVRAVVLFMEARQTSGEVLLSDEHDAYEWVPRKELTRMDLSDQLRSFLERYIASLAR